MMVFALGSRISSSDDSSVRSGDMTDSEADSTPRGNAIEIAGVTQIYEGGAPGETSFVAIKDVTLVAGQGEFIAIVGPSGCGKSTLLGLASGMIRPSIGKVYVNGSSLDGMRKDVGFIFQRDALLPWRSALENVALPLKFRGVSKRNATERSREWLARVGLSGFEDRYPYQLSGGMRKRVAVAATMVYEPSILLMDEPFSALDAQTRNLMENDLLALWQESGGQTVLFVTHDLEEAIGLSDRVVVLSASPGAVISSYAVPLPRPRNLLDVRLAEEFGTLYARIWGDLRDEVVRAYQQQSRLQ